MNLINLNRRLTAQKSLNSTNYAKRSNSTVVKWLIALCLIFIVIYLPFKGAYAAIKKLSQSTKLISQGAKQNNLDTIKTGVDQAKGATSSLNTNLTFLFWLRLVPFLGSYYSDAMHFSKAAQAEFDAAKIVVSLLEPYQNELGFTGQVTPGQDKIAQGLKVLTKIIPNLDKIEPNLKRASAQVSSIDVNKYPENFAGRKLRVEVETAKNFIIGASSLVSDNRQLLEVTPQALGSESSKTYLLIFQNDKELRATGGFMTAYAFIKLDKGHLSATQSDDIYRLDEKLLTVCLTKICDIKPPASIVKYLPEADGRVRTSWSMRDSNLSADLPTSLNEFERMYNLLGDKQPFDGIITIDTHVVEELIKITGPIVIDGTTYSADNDKRCGCPGVIYELERYAQVIEKGEKDRKAVLGILMQQLLARSLGASSEKLPEFISIGATLANQKHLMFLMHDNKTQKALDKLNWTGRILPTTGDYLHINDSNFAGGKSNLYVEQKINLQIDQKWHKLTIEYKNPQPFNVWLNGINRDYVRIYVPKGSKLESSKGSDELVNTQEDEKLDKTYFEAFITVRPQNSRVLSFQYSLPADTSEKTVLIQKQPGAKDHHYTIRVNNKKQEFDLNSDKNLNF